MEMRKFEDIIMVGLLGGCVGGQNGMSSMWRSGSQRRRRPKVSAVWAPRYPTSSGVDQWNPPWDPL